MRTATGCVSLLVSCLSGVGRFVCVLYAYLSSIPRRHGVQYRLPPTESRARRKPSRGEITENITEGGRARVCAVRMCVRVPLVIA